MAFPIKEAWPSLSFPQFHFPGNFPPPLLAEWRIDFKIQKFSTMKNEGLFLLD